MIFDSQKMNSIREKYVNFANYEIPQIVFLDRYDGYAHEREILENFVKCADHIKQKDWIHRLVNVDNRQHIGAWFEIMLFGWLKEHSVVQIEPEIQENFPDFLITIDKYQIAIEAKALLISSEEREKNIKINRIWGSLREIRKPFAINLDVKRLGEGIDSNYLQQDVGSWLDLPGDKSFTYKDYYGNILELTAYRYPSLKSIAVTSSEGIWVNPDILKQPLIEKAKQHRALRKLGHPYVIAIYLEPDYLSAEEVVESWFGKVSVIYNVDTNQVSEERLDQSGIHYFRNEIRHKSIAGTLVFKSNYDSNNNTRTLQGWYIQNPFANVFIDPTIFPVVSRFAVIGKTNEYYEMKWMK